jgi:8-amino-7-oxononanoate synthase
MLSENSSTPPPVAPIVRQLKSCVEKLCWITHHLTVYWTAAMPGSSCKQNAQRLDRPYNHPHHSGDTKLSGFNTIDAQLRDRDRDGLYRRRRTVASAQGRELQVDGRKLLNFCSNDYLGLANDDRVRAAYKEGIDQWGAGSGSSHLIAGHTTAHHELEAALADFTGRERCLLFGSGYAANMGSINALVGSGDFIFEDRLNHASLLDGGLLSKARFSRYQHRDLDDLEKQLAHRHDANGRKLVVTDGTFSMDGTVTDIANTAATVKQHSAWLMVDEAHSLGVVGDNGRGLVSADEFSSATVQVVIGTLGKAFGTQGGFAAGSAAMIETLIQHARAYIYSTALPAASAVATLTSLSIARQENWRRERLQELIENFRAGAFSLGLTLCDSATPIQPVILGDEHTALSVSAALEENGLLVTAIRPPTVPQGSSRLRITFTADHTDADLAALLAGLGRSLS